MTRISTSRSTETTKPILKDFALKKEVELYSSLSDGVPYTHEGNQGTLTLCKAGDLKKMTHLAADQCSLLKARPAILHLFLLPLVLIHLY